MIKTLGKFILEWRNPLGRPEAPYAYRWRLDFWWFSFRVHYWLGSDDLRAYHSHPVNFLTFILKGSYIDHYLDREGFSYNEILERGDLAFRGRGHRHCVEILEPVWSVLFTWGRPERYSFWLRDSLKKMNRDKYFLEMGHH